MELEGAIGRSFNEPLLVASLGQLIAAFMTGVRFVVMGYVTNTPEYDSAIKIPPSRPAMAFRCLAGFRFS